MVDGPQMLLHSVLVEHTRNETTFQGTASNRMRTLLWRCIVGSAGSSQEDVEDAEYEGASAAHDIMEEALEQLQTARRCISAAERQASDVPHNIMPDEPLPAHQSALVAVSRQPCLSSIQRPGTSLNPRGRYPSSSWSCVAGGAVRSSVPILSAGVRQGQGQAG